MIRTFIAASLAAAATAYQTSSRLEQILAQLGVESTNHTCLTTPKRNKEAVDKFYDLLASGKVYSDDDFTPDKSAIYWKDIDTIGPFDQGMDTLPVTWKRATQIPGNNTLWGKGVSADDIIQGNIGNCWFLAAASAAADADPTFITKAFHNTSNQLNAAGIYAVDFYTLGVPHTVVVDDFMPRTTGDDGVKKINAYADVSKSDQSMWGAILEKAFAKLVGNYLHTAGGYPYAGVRRIVGGPFKYLTHKGKTADAIWKELVAHEGKKDILTCGTGGGNDTMTNKDGLVLGHAFTIVGTHTLSNKQRLVQIRNPWGVEKFKGAWSDSSAKWTDKLKKEVGLKATKKDGIFWMAVEDFATQFEETHINYNTAGMSNASFVRLNDDKTGAVDCATKSAKCGRHTLTLKSDIDQTVWLTAHTWDARGLPTKCKTNKAGH